MILQYGTPGVTLVTLVTLPPIIDVDARACLRLKREPPSQASPF